MDGASHGSRPRGDEQAMAREVAIWRLSHALSDDGRVSRVTRVPNIEVVDDAGGFELVATAEALVRLADAMRESTRVEVGSDTGAVVVLLSEGPVAFSHVGRRVE